MNEIVIIIVSAVLFSVFLGLVKFWVEKFPFKSCSGKSQKEEKEPEEKEHFSVEPESDKEISESKKNLYGE